MESIFSGIKNKKVTRIGLGCVTFGREIGKAASFVMMDHAVENGITFFDTAPAYGSGASEIIVGEWLAANRSLSDSILVATKLLPPYTRNNILESVECSLSRLKIDSVDLLYFHRWDQALNKPDAFFAFDELFKQGKVRMTGACNFNTAQLSYSLALQREHGLPLLNFIQNNNNLAVQDVTDEMTGICSENGIHMVTYSPLGAGFLTGKHLDGSTKGSRFELIPGHQDIYFNDRALRRLERLRSVARRTGHSSIHLALAWALHRNGITSVLTGGRTINHIDQALSALAFDSPEIFKELESE